MDREFAFASPEKNVRTADLCRDVKSEPRSTQQHPRKQHMSDTQDRNAPIGLEARIDGPSPRAPTSILAPTPDQIAKSFVPLAERMIRNRIKNGERFAEDAVAIALSSLFTGNNRVDASILNDPKRLRNALVRRSITQTIDLLRKEEVRSHLNCGLLKDVAARGDEFETILTSEVLRQIEARLTRIELETFTAVLNGSTVEEAAAAASVSIGALDKRRRRLRDRLSEMLGGIH